MDPEQDISLEHSSAADLPTLSSTSPINTTLPEASSPRISPFHRKARPSADANAAELRDSAARTVKLFLRDNIREDWEYDPVSPPPPPSSSSHDVWRSRDGDSSGSEAEREAVWQHERYPYRFDSPDAIESSMLDRRRKRRRILKDELEWNRGLQIWSQRRDAWSGARRTGPARRQVAEKSSRTANGAKGADDQRHGLSINGTHEHDADSSDPVSTSTSRSSLSPTSNVGKYPAIAAPSSSDSEAESLVPVAPPLIPDSNPIRASIGPSIYPSIYSKVILQSLTPTVPMNLGDVTRAIVQGWKDEGQWPPQSTLLPAKDILQSKKKDRPDNGEKGRVRKGVGAVRKALGLSPSTNGLKNEAGQPDVNGTS